MRDSKTMRNVMEAHRRGYYVDEWGAVRSPRGKTRATNVDDAGFYRFNIWEVGRSRGHVPVHRLVAYQLYGDRALDERLFVRHLNTDRLDNRPENIELATRSVIQMDIEHSKRLAYAVNAASYLRRLTEGQVAELRAMRQAGATLKVLCARFGIAKSTASYIVNGKTYA